jgi:hypothetical protein
MRVAIDAMGGDYAPDEIIAGALDAIELLDETDELILVGPQQTVEARLSSLTYRKAAVSVVNAPDAIGMDEAPLESLRSQYCLQADKPLSIWYDGQCVFKTPAGNRKPKGGPHEHWPGGRKG